MRNIASKLALATVLAAGLAGPALADVTVFVTVDKTKDISITETISITKIVDINVLIDVELARAAEADVNVNQGISFNLVDRDVSSLVVGGPPGTDPLLEVLLDSGQILRVALIEDSIGSTTTGDNNIGVTGVNQDVGAFANQGNIWSVALTNEDPAAPSLFTDAQVEVSQRNTGNDVLYIDNPDGSVEEPLNGPVSINASIIDSIDGNLGITGVNQNAGNMSNQVNAVAIAAGAVLVDANGTSDPPPNTDFLDFGADDLTGAAVALSEAALGQENVGNEVTETTEAGTDKQASISVALVGNLGITQVNQAAGNNANQANLVSISAFVDIGGIGTE